MGRLSVPKWVIDWSPVAVVPPVLIVDAVLSSGGHPLTALNVACTFLAALPLAARHRLSCLVQIPLLVAGVTLVMWQLHPANTVVLLPMVALYELAYHGTRQLSLKIALMCIPSVVVGVVPFADGAGVGHIAALVGRNLVLCLLAIAAGDVVRSRERATARAIDAREQETLRRVAAERLRISREIHDVVAHAMTAINVQAGVAAHLLERDPGQAHGALRAIKRTSGDALGELRATLDVLRDPDCAAPLGPASPAAGLTQLDGLTAGLSAAGVQVILDVAALADIPADVQRAGYRIVQEALTNVARHAAASRASVRVARDGDAVAIEVTDDGCGCPESAVAGNGIRGMRERAAALGGTLHAAPGDDGGWTVRARLPVAAPATVPVA